MFGFAKKISAAGKNHSDCSGCGLCLLVCPVWRYSRDASLTPPGHFKALQHGVGASDIAASAWHCTVCMACEPVCPERIDITGIVLELRSQQSTPAWRRDLQLRLCERPARPFVVATRPTSIVLLPDASLHEYPDAMARIVSLLEASFSEDDCADVSLALEAGATIHEQCLERFVAPLRQMKKIIVADGLLLRHLKKWLPNANIVGLGEALSSHAAVRRGLRSTDLYVIEPRAYHSDYQRLVKHYDRMRAAYGCAFNLDLQRIAIPATARSLPQRLGLMASRDDGQTRWALHGRGIERIVVENVEERAALENVSGLPVVHVAELAG